MSTKEDIQELKRVEDTLTRNKVARFAYTDLAYQQDDADGVTVYDVNKEQNIPTNNADILKVNATVLSKGYRTKASSITRMLMNHFLGRLSYNLNKVNDVVSNLLSTLQTNLGNNISFATLDSNGRIPYSQLPESAIEFKGTWNAQTNTPILADGVGTKGDFYVVSVGGTQDLGSGEITFLENDRIIYNGTTWTKLNGGAVKTVNEVEPEASSGNVTLTAENINLKEPIASDITNVEEVAQKVFPLREEIIESNVNKVPSVDFLIKLVGSTMLGRYWKNSNLNISTSEPIIVYGNNIYVGITVGVRNIYYSNNGKNWSSVSIEDSIRSLIFYKNKFIIATNNGIFYSVNGEQWIKVATLTSAYSLYVVNNKLFSNSAVSEDGINWTSFNNIDTITSITCKDNLYVCVCSYSSSGAYDDGLAYSNDGINWTISKSGNYSVVNSNNDIFIAGGLGLIYSEDGINWTNTNKTNGQFRYNLNYINNLWLADSNGILYYSEDGKTWNPINLSNTDFIDKIIYANGIFVGTTTRLHDTYGQYYSFDGKTWIKNNFANSISADELMYANGTWLISLHNDKLYYSVDGINWIKTKEPSSKYHKIIYNNGMLLTLVSYSDVDTLIEEGWLK